MQKRPEQAPKENKAHGDLLFPLAVYRYDSKPGEPAVYCHWHEEAEFLLVLEGQTLFQIGTEYKPVRAGEAVFVHGGDLHAGHPLGDDGCRFIAVVFDMGWLRSGLNDRLQSEYIEPLLEGRRSLPSHYSNEPEWSAEVLRQIEGIVRDVESGRPGYELSVKSRLYRLLAEVAAGPYWIQRRPIQSVDRDKLEMLKIVLTYIEQHYRSKIYLSQLAEITHMDESRFCRFFKKLVHKTPIEYINGFRVKQAAELLQQGNRKMLDIALEVGFENPSYFIKRFREEMHCTPAEYRKNRLRHIAGE